MVVIILDNAPEPLRGLLTRWLIETKPGVFIGEVNARVRGKIWENVKDGNPQGALIVYSSNNEQGFQIDMIGEPRRTIIDLDGLCLIKRKQNQRFL